MAERLIDAEVFKKQIEKEIIRLNTNAHTHFCSTGEKDHITSTVAGAFVIVKDWLNMQPTIKAKPVVYGKWEVVSTETDKWVNKCSACGGYLKRGYKQTNYCPNCGAKMFGKEGK